MSSRRQMLEFLSLSRLTAELQEVKYQASSGTQYIDSGYQVSSNVKVISKYQPTITLYVNYSFLYFGSRVSVSNSNFVYNNGLNSVFLGTGTSQITLAKDNDLGIHNIEYGSNGYNIQSSTYNESGTFTLSIRTLLNLYIFARNDNGVASSNGTYKLFTFKIYDNNTLVRNFIPCYRKADNVAGLYDLVNGVFYTNAGTGTFIVGGNV